MNDHPAPVAPPVLGAPLFLAAAPVIPPHPEAAANLMAAAIAVLDAGDNLITVIDRILGGQGASLLLMHAANQWRQASAALGAALEQEAQP